MVSGLFATPEKMGMACLFALNINTLIALQKFRHDIQKNKGRADLFLGGLYAVLRLKISPNNKKTGLHIDYLKTMPICRVNLMES